MSQSQREERERERLSYRLLPGEVRHYLERLGAKISWSLYPAKEKSLGTVVLLHGIASNGSRWEEFAEKSFLHECWDILRLDLRGHAGSVSAKVGTLEIWSEDLKAILESANLKKIVLIGHSLGAQIAIKFAQLFPEFLRGLILLDPLFSQAFTEKTRRLTHKKPLIVAVDYISRFFNLLGFHRTIYPQNLRDKDQTARVMIAKGGKDLQAFIERYSSPRFDMKLIHLAQYARDVIETGRDTPGSEIFTMPTLVIAAQTGTYTDSRIVKEWVDAMPCGEIQTVHCVHWPLTECPDEVEAAIRSWFSKTKLQS